MFLSVSRNQTGKYQQEHRRDIPVLEEVVQLARNGEVGPRLRVDGVRLPYKAKFPVAQVAKV